MKKKKMPSRATMMTKTIKELDEAVSVVIILTVEDFMKSSLKEGPQIRIVSQIFERILYSQE